MPYEISLSSRAERQLRSLYGFMADRAGAPVAWLYTERVRDFCLRLKIFPHRGTKRDDIFPGIQTVGFEKRIIIAFKVREKRVVIHGVFYGGQDFESVLQKDGLTDEKNELNKSFS